MSSEIPGFPWPRSTGRKRPLRFGLATTDTTRGWERSTSETSGRGESKGRHKPREGMRPSALLVPKGLYRVDARGAARRDVAREHRDCPEQCRDSRERPDLGRADPVEDALEDAREQERAREPERD